MKRTVVAAGTCLLLSASLAILGQESDFVRGSYTKYEYRIPMHDGVQLFTAVYVPKDASRKYPILLNRTPYGVAPYGVDRYRTAVGPSEALMKEGFVFAYQDVRGRFMSEGVWDEMRPHNPHKKSGETDESTDTYDTIEWLVENVPGNTGKVGLWGVSYPGFYAAAGLIDAHPALKAASPQAPVADLFMGDDAFHNGAFLLAANFDFFTDFFEREGPPSVPVESDEERGFNYGTPDGYEFFLNMGPLSGARRYLNNNVYWEPYVTHTTYDAFWQARALPRFLKDVKPAVLTVGGWFDAENLAGPLSVYRAIEASSPGATNQIVMGPWSHGGWARGDGDALGNLRFWSATGAYYREKIELPFFLHHLKGERDPELSEASVFETGTDVWRTHDRWPPAAAKRKTLYFSPGGTLSFDPPAVETEAFDEYVSDPARPVPYLARAAVGMTYDYMTEDQRFASRRPDVLVYQSAPVPNDLTIAGPIDVGLHVSTTGTDSDFVVKLIDVYPGDFPDPPARGAGASTVRMGGYQRLIRGEPFRGKFRDSFERPKPFTPGEPARIEFRMPDVCHTFRRGHRVMVHVQSSWFPLVDLNPQKFMDIPKATPADFQKATERVYRWRGAPSSVSFLVCKQGG